MPLSLTGQLWYVTQGNTTDARLEYVNNDNSGNTVLVDNSPTTDLQTGFPEDVQVDWAAGVYFVLVNGDPAGGTGGKVLMGYVGSTAAPTVVYTAPVNDVVNTLQLDVFTHHVYVQHADANLTPTSTGILDFTYTPATVTPLTLTPVATNGGYLVRSSGETGIPNNATVGGVPVFDPRDFALDVNTNTLFFVNETDGTVNTNEIYRLNLSSPNTITPLLQQSQFPVPADGSGTAFTNGYLSGVEVDPSTGLVYFTTHSQHPSPDPSYNSATDKIYYIPETASGSTAAVALTITGLPGGNVFYPNHMTFDLANRQIYVDSEETDNGTTASSQDDVIYVLQLSADGHSASLINSIHPFTTPTGNADNISGLTFDELPTLGALSATTTHAVEQSASVTLLTAQPTITDINGDHLASATVQITGGTFSSNENSTADDHLSELSSGLSGTNITASYNSATETLTLTGYDTFAHYQQALAGVQYNTTGDNPTNYGNNTSRTITFQANDGAGGNPSGTTNVQTMTLNIDAVDDAPVNHLPGSNASGNEDTTFTISGVTITDVDADPANQNIQVTFSVTHGTLTLNTGVSGGIVVGDITGGANGTTTVTVTATQNQINATLGNATGLQYHGDLNFNTGFAAENLHIVTSDLNHTGSGGPLTDTDDLGITVNAVNDNPNLQPDTTSAVSYTENASATALFAGEAVDSPAADVDQSANYAGGSIDLNITGGAVTGDRISLTGSRFIISGTSVEDTANANAVVGTIGATNGTSHVTISSLTSAATPSVVDALIQSFGFDSTSDDPTAVDRTITLTFNDGGNTGTGGALTDAVTQTVHVTPVNDAPAATITPLSYNATEQVNLSLKNNGLSVSDVDGESGNETVTLSVTEGTLTLAAGTSGAIIDSGNNTNSVTFHGTLAQLNDLLNTNTTSSVLYNDNNDAPSSTATLTLAINDNGNTGTGPVGGLTNQDTATINIAAVNDAPNLQPDTTTAVSYTENATPTALFAGEAVDSPLADVDQSANYAGGSIDLQVTGGSVTGDGISLTGSRFIISGTSVEDSTNANVVVGTIGATNGTGHVTISSLTSAATPSVVDALIQSFGFASTSDDPTSADRTVTLTFNDGGNTGSGGGLTDAVTQTVQVTAVNDAPVNAVAANAQTVNEDTDLVFNSANANAISISDPDVESGTESVTLSASHGVLTLSQTTGLTITTGDGTADPTMTFTGTIADINAALDGLTYRGNQDYNGPDTLTITTNDQGNTGQDPGLTGDGTSEQDLDTVAITVNAVNDAPVIGGTTGVNTAYTEQNLAVAVDNTVTVTDVDSANLVGATVTISSGLQSGDTLHFTDQNGISFVSYTGGVLTLSGLASVANYQAALQSVTFDNQSNEDPTNGGANTTRAVSWQVDDGSGAGNQNLSNAPTTTITITPVNDVPTVATASSSFNGTPNVPVTIDGITFADVDSAGGSERAHVSSDSGTLAATANADSVTATSDGSGGFFLDGTTANLTTYITDGNLTISAPANTVVHVNLNDQGHTGPSAQTSTTSDINIVIDATPTINNLNGDSTTFVEDSAPILIDQAPAAVVADTDSTDFNGGNLTVAIASGGVAAEDALSIVDGNNISVAGNVVSYNGNAIGTVAGGTGGASLVVTFNTADATPAATTALVGQIAYQNTNTSNPNTADRTVRFTVDDGDGATSANNDVTVHITAVNDAPVIGGTAAVNTSYTEQNPAVTVDNGVTVSDVDSANLAGATVSITGGLQTGDTLHFVNQNGISFVSYTGGVLTLSGSSSVANYQTALESVTFDNLSNDDPTRTSATRTITWQVNDGSGSNNFSNAPTSTITITPVNDPPVIDTLQASANYTEQAAPVFLSPPIAPAPLIGVHITDPDPVPEDPSNSNNGLMLGATVTITNAVAGDRLLVRQNPLDPSDVPVTDGFVLGTNIEFHYDSTTHVLTFTSLNPNTPGDSEVDYEVALSNVTFDSTSDDPTNGGANPTRTLDWQVQDGGGIANGGVDESPIKTSTINVSAVNDGPVNTVPGAQSVDEDTNLVFSSAFGNAISTSDVDNASGNEQIQLSVSHGTLTLSQTTGLAFTTGDGTADATMTFTGTVANVNAALDGLTYVGNANYNGPDTLALNTDDQGNTGTPGALSDFDTVPITVNAVNDAPVLTGLGDTPSFIENGSPVLLDTNSNASVSDVELDAAGNYAGATLTLQRNGGANPDDVFGSQNPLDLTDVNGNGENVSLDGGATFIGTYTQPGDGSISFTFNANATATDVDSVMRSITYQNTSDNPPSSAQIDFTFDDGNGEPGGQAQGSGGAGITTASITVAITQVDDPPSLVNVSASAAYAPGSAGVALSPALGVGDPDATPPSPITGIHSGAVQIASGFFAGDELFVNLASSGGHFVTPDNVTTNISASYAAGTLTLSGTDTVQDYQAVLDAVSYRSTAADPSNSGTDPNRTITWEVSDGVLDNQATTPPIYPQTLLHFDVAPVVDLDGSSPGTGYTTTYTTGTAAIAIVNNDSVTDPDTANADSMAIVLTNAMTGDALSIAGSLPGGINSSIDTSVAGQITLRLFNSASLADYQTALSQVRFANSSVSPNTTNRDITVVLSESDVDSNTAHATVQVVDATPPAKPPAPDLTDATDSGVSHTDNITNVTAPTFTGTVEPGTTVRLYDSDGTTVIGTGAADAQTGAYTITSSVLSQGTHHLTVTATDASNNPSVHSDALDVTIDTTPPAPTLTAADPTTTFRNSIVHYTLSFPETTFGVDAGDLTLTQSGGAAGAAITGVTEPGGPGTPYTIPVSTGTGLGTLQLSLNSSGTGITDAAGNLSGGATGPLYSIVDRAPVAHNDVVALSAAQTTLTGNVLANDSDADGDALRVTSLFNFYNGVRQQVAVPVSGDVTLQSNHGAFTISSDGSYSFTANDARPAFNHYGDDPLVYTISDGFGGAVSAQLQVSLAGQQRPSTETFNFNFVDSRVSYGPDGEAYLTGPDGVVHNVTDVNLLVFNDGKINEGDYNQKIVSGPPPGITVAAGSALVDDLYYDSQYHDVYLAGIDPEAHYAANGWHEGRNPDPYFNTNYYLNQNPDVAAAGVNPLTHYDTYGWREGRNPSASFDTQDYLLANPDVASSGVDPLAQYLSVGESQNRVIFPANAGTDGPVDGFDPAYYLANNPDVAAAGVNPLQHYLVYGWQEGRNPSADFNTNYYESHNTDVAAAGIDPLLHYDQYGWHEGRDPSAVFSTNGYVTGYPDVAAAGVNPLQHFLQFGIAEGRSPTG